MLDTDVCVHFMRNRDAVIRDRFLEEAGKIALSTVSLQELIYGADRSDRPAHHRELVDDLTSRLEVLTFDQPAADQSGQIRAALAKRGQTIGPYDSLIAGHARSLGLAVVTGNVREYQRVDGLRIENWFPSRMPQ